MVVLRVLSFALVLFAMVNTEARRPCLPGADEPIGDLQKKAKVLGLRVTHSANADDMTQCSATVFRSLEGQMKIVSNAHCFRGGWKKIELIDYGFPVDNSKGQPLCHKQNWTDARVQRLDFGRDLAELKISEHSASRLSQQISPYEATDLSFTHPMSFRSDGIVGDLFSRKYSRQLPWTKGHSPSMITSFNPGVEGMKFIYRIGDLGIIRGMSGGATFTLSENLIGINVQYRPFEDSSIIIPMSEVEAFLGDQSKEILQDLGDPLTPKTVAAGLSPFDDSGRAPFGDGGRAPYGDGGSSVYRKPADGPLAQFLDTPEGIPDPENPRRILLGFKGEQSLSGSGIQIDGHDDLMFTKKFFRQNELGQRITRPHDGFPKVDIREEIFLRLKGRFSTLETGRFRSFTFDKGELSEDSLVGNPGLTESMTVASDGLVSIKIGIGGFEIDHEGSYSGSRFHGFAIELISEDLRTQNKQKNEPANSEAYKELVIRAGDQTLHCTNRNAFKLICLGADMALSLSLSSLPSPVLHLRMANRDPNDAKRYLFFFGDLREQLP